MHRKIIYLLIGSKGSGKSFIGSLIDQYLGIKFVRVEDLAKAIRRGRTINDKSYIEDAFHVIESGIRDVLVQSDSVVFESTGLTDSFDKMLENLRKDYVVFTIRIQANEILCLERVKVRDQSIHVNVSDEQIIEINRQVIEKDIKTDLIIRNENKSERYLIEEIKELFNNLDKNKK